MSQRYIYPVVSKGLSTEDRAKMLKQRAVVVWFTGLSGSGKSTLAMELERQLCARNHPCKLLDGDNLRTGINKNLGFSREDRIENIRRIAEIAKLFVENGIVTLAACISPTEQLRQMAREIIGAERFIEVHISTPLHECERRDTKGLYQKARQGVIQQFTGISAPFETPVAPALRLDTTEAQIEDSVKKLLDKILPIIEI